jgi:tetratricopeptide (TPR) repeat protein
MDQLREDVHHLAIMYPQRPLSHVLGDLVSVQDVIFSLLEQRHRPNQARDLYFLAGVTGGLLAKASHDLADPHAAMTQARTAFLCADNADHDGLRAWLRGLQALVAYWAGRHNEAIRYAQQGAEFATHARNSAMVWLPMNEARSWAALGNSTDTTAAIQRAEDSWDAVQADEMDDLGGIATFTRSRQIYYAADALAWLPTEAQQAERYSSQAVTAYADTEQPDWAFGDQAGSHSDLAIARIQQGELEGAIEALTPVLELPPEQRINGIIKSVNHVHAALVQAPASSETRDLQERIEFFTRTPMAALPR